MRRWSAYADLSPADSSALLNLPFTRKTFHKEGYLVREGQEVSPLCAAVERLRFRQKLLRNGSRQIISLHIQTEFVDLQNSSARYRRP